MEIIHVAIYIVSGVSKEEECRTSACSKPRNTFRKLDVTIVQYLAQLLLSLSQQDKALLADLIEFIATTLVAQLLQLANCCSSVNGEATGHTY